MSTSQQHITEGAGMTAGETRIYERLDEITDKLNEMSVSVGEINAHCVPCARMVASHEEAIKGNGKTGIETDVAVLKKGARGTLTVPDVIKLLVAIGTLITVISGAILIVAK